MEIRTILEDYRSSQVGGIMAGLMLWEMAVIPSFINNSETWTGLEDESTKQMEDLHSTLLRSLFSTARSTPKALLYWDTVVLPMAYRVEEKKLLFIHHLIPLPDSSLVKQFYVQQKLNSFPENSVITYKNYLKSKDQSIP